MLDLFGSYDRLYSLGDFNEFELVAWIRLCPKTFFLKVVEKTTVNTDATIYRFIRNIANQGHQVILKVLFSSTLNINAFAFEKPGQIAKAFCINVDCPR